MTDWGRWAQHRDPADLEDSEVARAEVQYAIDCAADALTNMFTALDLDESTETVETWSDRAFDGLRERLDNENLIYAIVMLLEERASTRSDKILKALGDEL